MIADNGSTDGTGAAVRKLIGEHPLFSYVYSATPGRGGALRRTWEDAATTLVGYMDVDLSTDPESFLALVAAIEHGAGIAVGSRLLPNSKTQRSLLRSFLSRCYNLLLKLLFRVRFTDAQCGCKALSSDWSRSLLPTVNDNHWFFDSELLVRAERFGCKIQEIPVTWKENTDSRVRIFRTVLHFISGLAKLRVELWLNRQR